MKKTKPTTYNIDQALKYSNLLQEYAPKFLQGSLFRRVSTTERFAFLNELARAKAHLWEQVSKTYPEAATLDTVVVSNTAVTWEIPNPETSLPQTEGEGSK